MPSQSQSLRIRVLRETDPLNIGKPNPKIALKYEKAITTSSAFLLINSVIFLVVGGCASKWFTTLYVGALAGVFGIFTSALIILLHKCYNQWRLTLFENLVKGEYPPSSTIWCIVLQSLITGLWYASALITIVYHAGVRSGSLNDDGHPRGQLSSWTELACAILCASVSTLLLVFQIVQRRVVGHEIQKVRKMMDK